MFLRAVQLEENPRDDSPGDGDSIRPFSRSGPTHAPALINLGTIHYNLRKYEQAEQHYRKATIADPEYALAFFDLGNVLDEMQRLTEATAAYQKAVALVPQYADAHYNLPSPTSGRDNAVAHCATGSPMSGSTPSVHGRSTRKSRRAKS